MYDDPQEDYNARHAPDIMFPTKPNKVCCRPLEPFRFESSRRTYREGSALN